MTDAPITPYETHSLNKIMACFELQREWSVLSMVKSLQAIGYPFDRSSQPAILHTPSLLKKQPSRISVVFNFLGSSNSPSRLQSVTDLPSPTGSPSSQGGTPQSDRDIDHLPLFRLLIQRVWGAYPGLIDLPIETWLGIERFIVDFNRRNFSTSRERGQFTKRAVVSIGFTKLLSSYITSVIPFRNLLAQPSRPSQEEIQSISQLPRFISLFGSRIKLIEWQDDKYLVIYRKKIQSSKFVMDSEPGETSSSRVKISLVRWPVLCESLTTVGQNKEFNQTQERLSFLQKVISSQSHQSEKLYQILEYNQLSASSFGDDVQQELKDFLNEELKFHEDWINAGKTIAETKQGYKKFLKKIVCGGELDLMYALAGKHENLETILDLDPMYEQAQSWVIMWIAYMLHFIFISGPDGDEICELLIKGLRIINPTLAIRATIALILGQPFGSLSLLQRILDSIVSHEICTFDNEIKKIVQSPSSSDQPSVPSLQRLHEAIKKYVYLGEEEKRKTRAEFGKFFCSAWPLDRVTLFNVEPIDQTHGGKHQLLDNSEEDIVILIIRWSEDFNTDDIDYIKESERIFKSSSDLDTANLFHDLIILLRLTSLKRDREQILEMILEADNPIVRTIEEILENYYATIYKIAQASDLSKKFGQTEAFLKDLIHLLVNRKEEHVSVDKLVKLLHQHKQSYWSFVNELVRYQDLCIPMKEWIRSCFDLVKSGLIQSGDASVPERFGLDFAKIYSHTPIETVREETRALSAYNQFVKIVDNMQYRSVFCSSSFMIETDFLNQAFQFLCELDHPSQFGKHLTQSKADARPPLPFGWAWWRNEKKANNRGREMLNNNRKEMANDEQVSSRQLVVNSDLKELQELTRVFYVHELTKSIHLLDRPEISSTPA